MNAQQQNNMKAQANEAAEKSQVHLLIIVYHLP